MLNTSPFSSHKYKHFFFFQFKMFPLGFMLMGNSMFTITFLIKNDRKNSDNQLNTVAIDH